MHPRAATALVLVAALVALAIPFAAATLAVHGEAHGIERELATMCNVEARSRWAPAALGEAECGATVGGGGDVSAAARAIVRATDDAQLEQWRDDLASGRPTSAAGAQPRALRDLACAPHDSSTFVQARREDTRALVAWLAIAASGDPDACVSGSVHVMQLGQRLAHGPSAAAYQAALGVTPLVARTLARCAERASPAVVVRAAGDVDALASRPPPWITPAAWDSYVTARAVGHAASASTAEVTIVSPWPSEERGELSAEWMRERRRVVDRHVSAVRAACARDGSIDEASSDGLRRVQQRSAACLRELGAALARGPLEERAVLERAPSCADAAWRD